jgi:hypothetical protein
MSTVVVAVVVAQSVLAQPTEVDVGIRTDRQGNIHLTTANISGQIIINGKPLDSLFEEFLVKKLNNLSTPCLDCSETADNSSAILLCTAGTYRNVTATIAADTTAGNVCIPCSVGAYTS